MADVSEKRIKELEGKFPSAKKRMELEKKHFSKFEKTANYLGNGIYSWAGAYSTDTRELFLLGILGIEGIYVEKK